MREAVIVDAIRTPIARGKMIRGNLSGIHAAHLLRKVQTAVCERSGIPTSEVEQIIGGCVTQAGEQSNNIVRHAWLSEGDDYTCGATTIDTVGTVTTGVWDGLFTYTDTLAGNPTWAAKECEFTTEGTSGGGFICEGNVGANKHTRNNL